MSDGESHFQVICTALALDSQVTKEEPTKGID